VLGCMAQRSLHAVMKVYYRSMSCFATVPPQALLAVLRFPPQAPLAPCGLGESPYQFPLLRARHTTYSIPN
jgi:hypothetical protein